MATTDREPVNTARRELATARRTLIDKLYAFEVATEALKEAKRKFAEESDELEDAQDAFNTAETAFTNARTAETTRLSDLQARLAVWLPDNTPAEEDITRLLGSEPIVLFPVRLETRFDGGFLRVRVYPDEIFLNTHETALTVPEYDAAKAYYVALNESNKEKELWRDMVARFGVERSAYILRQMLPIFGEAGLTMTSSYHLSSSTCGGTLIGGQKTQLYFPQDIQFRTDNWTRPGEGILPDRWVVVTYQGNSRRVTLGKRIVEPLAMTADPKLEASDLADVEGEGSYQIDENIRWTIDYTRAEQIGMGINVQLQGTEGTAGFDRVIVVGVKSSMNEIDTSRMLEKLFDAHHYTRGMAILRPGTPTNNTEGHPTPYPPKENAGQDSFIVERQRAPLDREFSHHCLPFNANGHLLGMALGVPSGVWANVDRAYLTDQFEASSMNRAMWPGTIGYFMQHMMGRTIFSASHIESARQYFGAWVQARGPAPAFRIGATPYGVLPIASLRDWAPRNFGDADQSTHPSVEAALLTPLKTLFETWIDGVGQVPRVRNVRRETQPPPNPRNPDAELATVLSTSASAREFRVRFGHTAPVQWLLFHFFGWDYRQVVERLDQQTQATLGRLGFPLWRPPIGRTLFYDPQPLFTGDIVAPELSETTDLAQAGINFINGIRNADVPTLNQGTNVPGRPATANLLYTMLRHATMTEYARIAKQLMNQIWIEYYIFNVPSLANSGIVFIIQLLLSIAATVKSNATDHLNQLFILANKPTAELERLFTETLDLVSYRLDAWISAFAARRLDDMRRAQVTSRLMPRGDFLGGYGWLENVRPRVHPTETVDGVVVERQLGNGGFIHAPSMTHATAAAILRNGHMSFRQDNPDAYGIDLSSARVRKGRWLFEGVRNGQPVGALLGYQLERGLHEGHPGVTGLDQLRFDLRKRFPLVANKTGDDGNDPAEAIAARNVVDGSLLLRAFKSGEARFGVDGIPSATSGQGLALQAELDNLDAMYDATADLLTAESVFQLARGNIDAAVPTMNNVVEGNQPPDSIISRSARGGAGLAHRVALVFPSNDRPTLPTAQWGTVRTPRGIADQDLNAWLGQLIGNPAQVTASLSYLDAEGAVINTVTISLADLHLDPLDVLALAEVVAKSNQGSVLDQQIIAVGLTDPNRQPTAPPASFKIEYEVATGRTFSEVLEAIGTAASVVAAGRSLEIKDLLPPVEIEDALEEEEAEPIGGTNAKAFFRRGLQARTDLTQARAALAAATGAAVRAALIQASRIVPMSAFPDPRVPDAALAEQAAAVLKELDRRVAALPALLPDDDTVLDTIPSADLLANGQQAIEATFGPDFRALPDVDPPRFPEIQLALDARATLVDGDDAAPDKYLQRLAHSRERVSRWRKLNIYARVFGQGRPRVDVVQLPHVPGEKWLGVGFDVPDNSNPEQVRNLPEEGRSGVLLLNYAASLDPSVSWRGLIIDDWTEVIPNQVEETGIALNFDSPQSQAPQAVLVATPSRATGNWSFNELINSLEQTMDMMKIRAVSTEYIDMGQTLPMAIIPGSEGVSFALSTLFESLRVGVDTEGLSNG